MDRFASFLPGLNLQESECILPWVILNAYHHANECVDALLKQPRTIQDPTPSKRSRRGCWQQSDAPRGRPAELDRMLGTGSGMPLLRRLLLQEPEAREVIVGDVRVLEKARAMGNLEIVDLLERVGA